MAEEERDDAEQEEYEAWTPRIERSWEAIEFAPEKYQQDRNFMLKLFKRPNAGHAFKFAGEELREDIEDYEFCIAAVRTSFGDLEVFKQMPKEMHRNRPFMLKCAEVNSEILSKVTNKAKNDEDAKTKSIKGVFYCNRRAGKDSLPFPTGTCNPVSGAQCESCSRLLDDPDNCPLPQDRAFLLKALKKNSQVLKYADTELKGEKDIVMQAVTTGGFAIMYGSEELRADRDIALAAVKQNWQVFRILNKRLRADREIAEAALHQDWHAFQVAAKELKADRDLAMKVVEQSWQSFEFLQLAHRKDRELAMKAVTQDWRAFKHMAKELKGDRELALVACRQNGEALGLTNEPLREDRDLVLVAIRQSWPAIAHAAPSLRGDKAIMMELVQKSGFALKHAVEDLKSDPELHKAAMTQEWAATDIAVHPLFPKEDGLDPKFWASLSEAPGVMGVKLKPAVPLLPLTK